MVSSDENVVYCQNCLCVDSNPSNLQWRKWALQVIENISDTSLHNTAQGKSDFEE